jgi:ubiquinone/menaquinone biosynthesis C-methylase UbiE
MYICPISRSKLIKEQSDLVSPEGIKYPIIGAKGNVVSFASAENEPENNHQNELMYSMDDSIEKYKNFLNWLLQTFKTDAVSFRECIVDRLLLKPGYKVLITGCGLGDDVDVILKKIGQEGVLCAQDLSKSMVLHAAENRFANNLYYSVSNAENLPYEDNYFDAIFHFGGINLFGSIKKAIAEMERVVKVGGRVVFGDEGVAPWLKNIEYGKVVINNNTLWAASPPMDYLPSNAKDVRLEWVLGNCFYLISYEIGSGTPDINMDVEHIGPRGGTMRTRFYGQLEGVSEKYKTYVLKEARKNDMSINKFLESMIYESIQKK